MGLHYETGGVSLVKTNYGFVLIISVARLPAGVHKVGRRDGRSRGLKEMQMTCKLES